MLAGDKNFTVQIVPVCLSLQRVRRIARLAVAKYALFLCSFPMPCAHAHAPLFLSQVGLVFTHREKFRSDMCIRYCAPITVSGATLQAHSDAFTAAKQVPLSLSRVLRTQLINPRFRVAVD